jgi:bifunctional oligoribonuclease and PAP phosphatase NrnA
LQPPLLKILRAGSRFLVTTHDFPDGDGLGSQIALVRALRAAGKTAYAVNPGPTPEKFALVDPDTEIQIFSGGSLPEVDAVLILDTNELKMLGSMEKPLAGLGKPLLFIDHHSSAAMPPGDHFVDENYAATGELVYNVIRGLGVTLDERMATALYVAIVTDTAGFRYKRTSPLSHRIAAELLELGVQPEKVYLTIFARESVAKTRLLGWTLERLQTTTDGKVAWVVVPAADRLRSGATVEDTESFVGFLTLLKGVQIGVLFREEDDGRVKISLRGMGEVPVIDIARTMGGGGHPFAAGARVTEPMAGVIARTLAACQQALS